MRGITFLFFFKAEDGMRDLTVTGVQTCALPICRVGWPRGDRADPSRRRNEAPSDAARRSAASKPLAARDLDFRLPRGRGLLAGGSLVPALDRKSVAGLLSGLASPLSERIRAGRHQRVGLAQSVVRIQGSLGFSAL